MLLLLVVLAVRLRWLLLARASGLRLRWRLGALAVVTLRRARWRVEATGARLARLSVSLRTALGIVAIWWVATIGRIAAVRLIGIGRHSIAAILAIRSLARLLYRGERRRAW